MVGKPQGAIAGAMIAAAITVIAASLASAVAAQDNSQVAPDAKRACPANPIMEDALRSRTQPLALPTDWSGFADMSMNWLAVRTRMDAVHCVETAWFDQVDGYDQLGDRFLGLAWQGYEAWGYMLIDTAGTGTGMDVGAKPALSPSGEKFATLHLSDAGWGGFEGFAVWRTSPGGMTPLHVDTHLPYMVDWRIDRWEGDDCLHISAVPQDRIANWEDLPTTARDAYVSCAATAWDIAPGSLCPTY